MLDLAIRDLEVRFPGLDQPVLAISELALPAGSQVALTGPSGSGKTTFINVVTGLEPATSGHVAWRGTDLEALSESRRDRWRAANVGLVMQDFHLFPGLSAIDNVLLPQRLARLRRLPALTEEARRLLTRVGILRHGQPVETMSRGQMQRVAVARALVARPGVIVADEPTASLDAESGTAVADLLIELVSEAGATLIVASHDPRFVGRLGRVLRLDGGRLLH
ncbi:ATP-binding cassette domain-containing protein [Aurantimonas sp. MSK8Z-1]|uniref:ABC transporter ATP-binding protein n=1 Tax=Mangrovibrevibacter kandeliae TaxID=2968473 RepID=UPI002118313F|nr:ATP-binding cassette domain-containing protein [Aurantimonas sp. MSK8Z-1]MCW4116051.1 ATP-binding cassette domain-containing protein [Aurantimonas sp. MSK8Z-1]